MIPINSNALISFSNLTDKNGNFINDAVITAQLVDRNTAIAIAGISTLTLSNTAPGLYQGTIPASQTNNLTVDQEVRVIFTITENGEQIYAKEDHLARYLSV